VTRTPPDPTDGSRTVQDNRFWEDARALLARVVAWKTLGLSSREDVEDLAQTACEDLLGAIERGGVRDVEGLMVKIAKDVAMDWLRKNMKNRGRTIPIDEIDEIEEFKQDPAVLEAGEVQFYVRELLKSLNAMCSELFDRWLGLLNLRLVAEQLHASHQATRKRWERCLPHARELLMADNSELGIRIQAFIEAL